MSGKDYQEQGGENVISAGSEPSHAGTCFGLLWNPVCSDKMKGHALPKGHGLLMLCAGPHMEISCWHSMWAARQAGGKNRLLLDHSKLFEFSDKYMQL